MNIYVDESGSINNHDPDNKYFIIALVYTEDSKSLKRSYKRFVSANIERLAILDKEKTVHRNGVSYRVGGKMFKDGKFNELKGSQFDREMKLEFVDFMMQKPNFSVFYIKIANDKLDDKICDNTARAFNYCIKLALEYFIKHRLLPNEACSIQLDERNERTETKYFLENYLNTELVLGGVAKENFKVSYFDSANNICVQIADVFANLMYSELKTGGYSEKIEELKDAGFIKHVFEFPL